MDGMSIDGNGATSSENIISGLVAHVEARRANVMFSSGTYWAIMPDWAYELLTATDRENLIALYDIRVRRRREVDAEEQRV